MSQTNRRRSSYVYHPYTDDLLWVTPVEFRGDLWHQKTRVPGLSCGVVSVILRLAVLVEL